MSLCCSSHKPRRRARCASPGTAPVAGWRVAALLLGVWGVAPPAMAASAQATVIHDFGVTLNDGEFPVAALVSASDGNLYGVTNGGGTLGAGAVFRLESDGAVSVVYSFGTAYIPLDDDGHSPYGDLLAHADGRLYGTTRGGGLSSHGTVFRVSLLGAYEKLYDFGGSASDGTEPYAGLVQGADGNLYGTTLRGGPYSDSATDGTIFRISTTGDYAQVYAFGASAQDGAWPYAGLTVGGDGNLYGTTFFSPPRVAQEGGAGTVFRYSPGAGVARIYEFNTTGTCASDGAAPDTTMILGADGNFYGTTSSGGAHGDGTVFRATPAGKVSVLYSFGSIENDGRQPVGKLLQLADGTLLGTTRFGGEHEAADNYGGTVFTLEPDGAYTRLYSFGATAADGQWLDAGITRAPDGYFYGTTTKGGASANRPDFAGAGTVYRLTINPAGTGQTFRSTPSVCPIEDDSPDGNDDGAGGALSLSWILVLGLGSLCTTWRGGRAQAGTPLSCRLNSGTGFA